MSVKRIASSPRLGHWMAIANLVTAAAALLLASFFLVLFQFLSLRATLIEDVNVQARIIGDNSAAALLFNDRPAGEETLAALAASPSIVAAGIFNLRRVPQAMYRRGDAAAVEAPSDALLKAGHHFGWQYLDVARAFEIDRQRIGYVTIRVSLEQLYSRLIGFAGLTLAVALGSLAAAFLLVTRMRRRVRNAEAHLHYLAHVDPITGLPNRHAFNERLAFALSKVDQFGGAVGLLLLDLDNFKIVNDTLGHQNGDKLLALVAQRLTECLRNVDIICRIGGDEFAVILEARAEAIDSASVAEKILEALAAPVALDTREIYVTASIGISLYPQDGADLQTLTRNADTAMYQAKGKGKNAYEKFHQEMDRRAQKRLSLETSLRKALERDELLVYYQPQIDLQEGRIAGVEALLRWNHPELGMVGPNDFIPMAEESGLIVPIGRWVLHTACRQVAAWRDAGFGTIHVAVNLSVRQTKDPHLMGDILAALHQAGLAPAQLELEITETALMENVLANVELLHRLQTEGIRLSIDDFGTGYSSMAYLKRFPIDQVKIDRTFVRDIPGDGDDEAIISAIIAMAHSLGLSVVAEGVETEAQLQFLRAARCDIMQGYYLARPLPVEQMTDLLRERLK
jgi:diguanylate cyclase